MNIPHPTYPLQQEQRVAVLRATKEGAGPAAIRLIRDAYDRRRDEEHPGWLERYNVEIETWATANGATR